MSEPRTMNQKLTDILYEIGIPVNIKGYYYVRDAILLLIENDELMKAVTGKLYPMVAEKHNTSVSRVERAIRNFLIAACRRGNTPFINRLFGPDAAERGITNKEFIATLADLLKNADMLIHEDYPATAIAEP